MSAFTYKSNNTMVTIDEKVTPNLYRTLTNPGKALKNTQPLLSQYEIKIIDIGENQKQIYHKLRISVIGRVLISAGEFVFTTELFSELYFNGQIMTIDVKKEIEATKFPQIKPEEVPTIMKMLQDMMVKLNSIEAKILSK